MRRVDVCVREGACAGLRHATVGPSACWGCRGVNQLIKEDAVLAPDQRVLDVRKRVHTSSACWVLAVALNQGADKARAIPTPEFGYMKLERRIWTQPSAMWRACGTRGWARGQSLSRLGLQMFGGSCSYADNSESNHDDQHL
eukprot:307726-Rhodomonas_salina.3